MSRSTASRAFGTMIDPAEIPWDRITSKRLLQVLRGLDPVERRQFHADYDCYRRTGAASALLLGCLAVAAGREHGPTGSALVISLGGNVVGVLSEPSGTGR